MRRALLRIRDDALAGSASQALATQQSATGPGCRLELRTAQWPGEVRLTRVFETSESISDGSRTQNGWLRHAGPSKRSRSGSRVSNTGQTAQASAADRDARRSQRPPLFGCGHRAAASADSQQPRQEVFAELGQERCWSWPGAWKSR